MGIDILFSVEFKHFAECCIQSVQSNFFVGAVIEMLSLVRNILSTQVEVHWLVDYDLAIWVHVIFLPRHQKIDCFL